MPTVGDKYIIEIGEISKGAESGLPKYRIKGFDNLIFDDKGLQRLRTLEHEQQKVYENGYNFGFSEGFKQGQIDINSSDINNTDDSYIKGYQAATLKYTKIIHEMIDAYEKLTDIEEED